MAAGVTSRIPGAVDAYATLDCQRCLMCAWPTSRRDIVAPSDQPDTASTIDIVRCGRVGRAGREAVPEGESRCRDVKSLVASLPRSS